VFKILRGIQFRLEPKEEQETLFRKHVGSCRFIYNKVLADRKDYYEKYKEPVSRLHYQAKLPGWKVEFPWLKEIDSTALQIALIDQEQAYKNFFRGSGFPKFKSKKRDRDSFRIQNTNESLRFQGRQIRLNKIGFVNLTRASKTLKRLPRDYRIKSATVFLDSDQHWYVSVLIECEDQTHLPELDNIIGIDLGIKNNYTFCYQDEDEKIAFYIQDNPRAFEKHVEKLQQLNREYARKEKGSKNQEKARIRLAKKHFKVKCIRKDFNHQLSKFLIDNFQYIVIEDLGLDEMKQKGLGRSISDLSFHQFKTFLKYKSEWYGRELVIVGKYFPSTKICAECGFKNDTLTLKDREYTCPSCKTKLDRDNNASKNLFQVGICYKDSGEVLDGKHYMDHFI
jgi:putative transposase